MHPILRYLWKVIQTSLVEIDLFQPYKDCYEICSGFSCRASVLQCFSCLQHQKVFSLIRFGGSWRLVCHWGPIVAEICAWRVFFSTTSSMQCLVLWGWNFKFLTGDFLLWPNNFNALSWIVFSRKCSLSVLVSSVWSLLYTVLLSWDQCS